MNIQLVLITLREMTSNTKYCQLKLKNINRRL